MKAEVVYLGLVFFGGIMGFVTGLEMNIAKNKARLYIDGSHVLTLSAEVALRHRLKTGMEISESHLQSLREDEEIYCCGQAAYRLLAFRARSEKELRDRLTRKGFSPGTVGKSLDSLKACGLVNDAEFGRQWVENRQNFKPQSAFLTRRELKEKGLSEDIIEKAVKNHNDYENALLAARPKVMKNKDVDYAVFRRRICGFLQRRGFGYGVIKPVADQLWKELSQNQNSREDLH